MKSLYNFNNENLGYKVSSNGKFVVIGNPNTKDYNTNEGLSRIGEVLLYFKDSYNDNYTLLKSFTKPYLESLISLDDYEPVNFAFNFESGSYNHNKYGRSLDISDEYLAIGDYDFLQKFYYYSTSIDNITSTSSVNLSSVEVYKISQTSSLDGCNNITDSGYSINNSPVFSITSSVEEQFGFEVSISEDYLLVGAPGFNNNSGSVYLYKKQTDDTYDLISHISSSDESYIRFGSSLAFDKKNQDKFIVGSKSENNEKVFIYEKNENDNWNLYQTLYKNTSSAYLNIENSDFYFLPISQSNSRFGFSVDIEDDIAVVGDPNDLIYYEYSGSNNIRERGSFYIYNKELCVTGSQYSLFQKSYGTDSTFKDNLLGYDISIKDKKILVSSPKPYFPFSSLYLYDSIGSFEKYLNVGDFGESSFNGQSLLFEYNSTLKKLNKLTDIPINYRKDLNEPFSAFGNSVSLSTSNLVIGSPLILNDDLYINNPILAEQSSSAPTECNASPVDVVSFILEQDTLNEDGNYITASIVNEVPNTEELTGKCFIYDFSNLKQNYIVGNVFYNNAKIILNSSGSIFNNLVRDPFDNEKSYIYMDYKSEISFNEKQYICTINPGEFNISSNPTSQNLIDFEWNILNKPRFDFSSLDLILRYINKKITISNSEFWKDTFVSTNEESIYEYYTDNQNVTSNRLTDKLTCELTNLSFDVNGDGTTNILDGYLIWKYFAGTLSVKNFKNYITDKSTRKSYDEIISYLDTVTGKNFKNTVKNEFFNFKENSQRDITGSYLAPYITQVGLYDGTDLVATAKLAHPIKNTGEIPINIVIKWDI